VPLPPQLTLITAKPCLSTCIKLRSSPHHRHHSWLMLGMHYSVHRTLHMPAMAGLLQQPGAAPLTSL
jgi:hypothetical protein